MSKISNSNVLVGGSVSASQINNKFSDVATATATIDANNVSYEGIDSTQLKQSYLIVRRGYADNEVTNATSGIAYSMLKNGSVGSGAQAVSHVGSTSGSTGLLLDFSSDPLRLKAGDLLRVWHACHLFKHEWGDYIATGRGAYSSGTVKHVMTTFPMWATSSVFSKSGTATTGFEPFPGWSNQWTRSTMSGGDPIEVQQPGMSGSSYNSRSYGLALYPLHGVKISSSEMRTRYTGGSALNYVHQGSDLLVYGIRVFTVGPLRYERYSSSGADYLSLTEATTAHAANFNNAYFSTGHVGFMQMRGGSF